MKKETQESPVSEHIEQMQKDIKTVREFIDAIEKIGGAVPGPVKAAITAIEAGTSVAESAEEVDKWLKEVYEGLYSACEEGASALHEKDTIDWDNHKTMCEVKHDRKWQQRNINAVLLWNNDKSLVRRLWEKFKNQIPGWIGDFAKDKAGEAITPAP